MKKLKNSTNLVLFSLGNLRGNLDHIFSAQKRLGFYLIQVPYFTDKKMEFQGG